MPSSPRPCRSATRATSVRRVDVVEPGTGKVLAMAQATDFGRASSTSTSTSATAAASTATSSARPPRCTRSSPRSSPGCRSTPRSTSPFASTKQDHVFTATKVIDAKCGTDQGVGGQERLHDRRRQMTLAEGISKSINTWVRPSSTIDVGACKVHDDDERHGRHQGDGKPIDTRPSRPSPSASGTTTPLDLASAYATLAARGKYCEPTPIVSITTPDGKDIKVPPTACKQVISADIADGVTHLLQGTLCDSGGTAEGSWNVKQRPAAGKTGTTKQRTTSRGSSATPRSARPRSGSATSRSGQATAKLYSLNGKCFGYLRLLSERLRWHGRRPRLGGDHEEARPTGCRSSSSQRRATKARRRQLRGPPERHRPQPGHRRRILEAAGFNGQVGGPSRAARPKGTVGRHLAVGQALPGGTVTLLISSGPAPAAKQPDRPSPPSRVEGRRRSPRWPTTPARRQRLTAPIGAPRREPHAGEDPP